MKRFNLLFATCLILLLVAAACGGDVQAPTATKPAPTATTGATLTQEATAPSAAPVSSASHADLGSILVDEDGKSLYLFTNDEQGGSTCTGGCTSAWPPLMTGGDPTAGGGVDGALLGTIIRDDGSVQVSYNGWPLYRYGVDQEPGDTNGHEVGGVWFAVSTVGEPAGQDSADGGGAISDSY